MIVFLVLTLIGPLADSQRPSDEAIAAACERYPSIVELEQGRLGCLQSNAPEDIAALRAVDREAIQSERLRFVYIRDMGVDGEAEPMVVELERGPEAR